MATLPTKPQYPVNGKFKKDFKVTSDYGYRVHPITKAKKHHNGTDLWGAKEPLLVENWYDGVVIVKATNMAGFGHYVVIRHKVGRTWVTSLYAHLKAPSKLKKGQKVDAGTVVGIMGTSGASTGKHLHFEIGKGKTHPFISGGDGSRYFNPLKFVTSTIKKWEAEKELLSETAEAVLPTPADAAVQAFPEHSLAPSEVKPPVAKPRVTKAPVAKAPVKKKTA
jgi:murein DD-endopeptidase MepM/ murein hydrolase activator NlpD